MGAMLHRIKLEDLKDITPSVFATRRNTKMSEKYVHIRSADILETLADRGYVVTQAAQDHARQRDPNYVRHELRLTHTSRIGKPAKVGDTVPQIVLENSGNGRTKLRLRAGLYRYWCANGCTTGSSFEIIELVHMRDIKTVVNDAVDRIIAQFERLDDVIHAWPLIEMSNYKMTKFAKDALVARFGTEGAKAYNPKDLLEVRRAEDEGNNLWVVYNRIQENIMKGGFQGEAANGRVIGVRELKGITSQRDLNIQLWDLAEKVAA